MRDSGYGTYIVAAGGQDFVRMYSDRVYSIPPEQVIEPPEAQPKDLTGMADLS
jgi:hypothetical protein